MAISYVSIDNLQRYDNNLKNWVKSDKTNSFKAVNVKDNKINFYVNPSPTEDMAADAVIDIPVEYFLDQTKTVFVQEFVWSNDAYVGSENPNLEGKPVLVMAIKGDDDSVSYSFVNLEALIDVYTTDDTKTVSMEIGEGNVIKSSVKVSTEAGNILSIKEDGLFAEAVLDISSKADKLVNPDGGTPVIKLGQILVDDGSGNLSGSGKTIAELTETILEEFEEITNEEIDSWFE